MEKFARWRIRGDREGWCEHVAWKMNGGEGLWGGDRERTCGGARARTMTLAVEESRTHSDSGGDRERTMTPAVEELARIDLMAGEQGWRGGGLEEERVGAVEAWRKRGFASR